MSKNKYLIPEPTTEISSEYLGTLLITQNANQYACKKKTDKDNWWAIGMIASNGSYWTPVIVSNKKEYCYSYSDAFFSETPLSGLTGYFHYKGNTYYSSFSAYGSNLISSDLPNASVPVCSESIEFDGAVEAGKKLIELYVASGGLMPGEGYHTSWVRKLVGNVWQKTFAFAHAKTVYTDFANKKTLADKLSEIDTEIGNKANKTEIPTELPANGGNSATVNGHTVNADVPENAVFTDTVYDDTGVKESISAQSTEIISIKNTANFSHNIPRNVPKDITSYITDGTFYKRLNGTDGFELFEDIYVGDYIKMSRAITCPDSTGGAVGSQYVTIAGLDTMMNNGEDGKYVNYHHAVMVPGQGFEGIQHFGRHAMNATNTTEGGYVASVMNQSVLGAVATEGSTASGATINQQLYAEFGSHLKTTEELLSTGINATGTNRFGTANGCSNNWGWSMRQAVLMSEVEVYGSTVWSSSGYDTGNAKMQLPLFAHSRNAMNDRSGWYWLKDAASSAGFCGCSNYGYAGYDDAGDTWTSVRPRFIIAA